MVGLFCTLSWLIFMVMLRDEIQGHLSVLNYAPLESCWSLHLNGFQIFREIGCFIVLFSIFRFEYLLCWYWQRTALENGLVLVDTKYEFGKGPDGTVLLIDEVISCETNWNRWTPNITTWLYDENCSFPVWQFLGAYARLEQVLDCPFLWGTLSEWSWTWKYWQGSFLTCAIWLHCTVLQGLEVWFTSNELKESSFTNLYTILSYHHKFFPF